jgi:outer membrane lipase/esterase
MFSMGNWAQRAIKGMGAGLLLGMLASCGGGTDQVDPFEPTRYMAFGDATSVITRPGPQGLKYAVNAVGSDGITPDCTISTSNQPSLLWTQILGNTFNFVFEECNPNGRTKFAFIYARPDAKSADFVAQLAEARVAHGAFSCKDLMSVLIGVNDVIDLYENVYLANPTPSTANAVASELSARGTRLGQAIAALTDNNGPNIIVSTIPRINQTPYGRQQAALWPGLNVPNVLSQFSDAFNTALRTAIPNDGSRWGLVELDAIVNAAINDPDNYDLDNVRDAVCAKDLPECKNVTADLVPGGNAETWLWASDRWIGWRAHSRLGNFSRTRAQDNPFGCA